MRDDINTGGPAFPVVAENGLGHIADGMTLRDYFAAQFMARAQSLCEMADGGWDEGNVAQCAYSMADAMIAARGA
jgi:hypothetical protein